MLDMGTLLDVIIMLAFLLVAVPLVSFLASPPFPLRNLPFRIRKSLLGSVTFWAICGIVALILSWWIWSIPLAATPTAHATASLATVGGAGGIVALVVAFRKQALNERNSAQNEINDAVQLLAHNQPTARIAGVYALIRVGNHEPSLQQQTIDILCGYLRSTRQNDGAVESTIIAQLQHQLSGKNHWLNINLDLHDATITENFTLSECIVANANFTGATFNNFAYFDGATFNNANFNKSTFNDIALFTKSTFNDEALFNGATFNNDANFFQASFNDAHFTGVTNHGEMRFFGSTLNGKPYNPFR